MNDTNEVGDSVNKKTDDVNAPKFVAGQVVLLEVPHVRVLAGETDALVERARGGCVERELVYACSGELCPKGAEPWACPTPEDFAERWDEENKRMVCVMLFASLEDAARFRKKIRELDAAVAAGTLDGGEWNCRLVENAEWEREEAAHASEEWAKARKSAVEKAQKAVYREVCEDDGVCDRVVVIRIGGGKDSEKRAGNIVEDALGYAVSECRDPFVIASAKDEEEDCLWTVVGARRKVHSDVDALVNRIENGFKKSNLEKCSVVQMGIYTIGGIANIPNTPLFMLEAVCAKLRSIDRKADMEKAVCD